MKELLIKRPYLITILEFFVIIGLSCVPLFLTFPYRVNIFLSWEGAYRLSQGHIPYKDFGMPLGFMYWVIPATFFKIFGPQMITLVKAQVLINIISGTAFRSIFKSIGVQPGIRMMAVILYCASYSFFNFWPWYNHTVIVYQMVALAILSSYIFSPSLKIYKLVLCALFVFFSFFTKQDGGALAFLLCTALLTYHCIQSKRWKDLIIFLTSFAIILTSVILWLRNYNFGYWFNYGQAPHQSRFSLFEILDEFLSTSQWIKFYIFIVVLLSVFYFKKWKDLLTNKKEAFLLILTLGILAEAAILQVTSYTPPDNNIFFHSFAFVIILVYLASFLSIDFSRMKFILIGSIGMLLWWSGVFWKYFQRISERFMSPVETLVKSNENIVNRKTYMISNDPPDIPTSQWVFSNIHAFEKIYMPKPTIDGIQRLLADEEIRNKPDLKVLNMTELTPLAIEIPYNLEKSPETPLWFHLGVSMFNKDAERMEKRISSKYYDVVLFEYIPTLNNFYPFRVRDSLHHHYQKVDSFLAPRREGDTDGIIEVFKK